MPRALTMEQAREIRQWWKDNVHRVNNGEVTTPVLRKELAEKVGLHPTTLRSLLGGLTYREPNA